MVGLGVVVSWRVAGCCAPHWGDVAGLGMAGVVRRVGATWRGLGVAGRGGLAGCCMTWRGVACREGQSWALRSALSSVGEWEKEKKNLSCMLCWGGVAGWHVASHVRRVGAGTNGGGERVRGGGNGLQRPGGGVVACCESCRGKRVGAGANGDGKRARGSGNSLQRPG
ncbi:hypothetical protein EDB85DRAFT_1895415 [Lactarius pseudohatsudake]|nr:hypothetical protein EDB85DRAFT_1895415 [Lactarius pseudohatsudake]